MKSKLNDICKNLNIEYMGISNIGPYLELKEILEMRNKEGYYTPFDGSDMDKKVDPKLTMENVKSIIVCLFPYLTDNMEKSNLSKYTHSIDYHIIVKNKLNKIGEELEKEIDGFEYMSFVDTGPLVDRYLAYQAGLGFFGINSHIITEKYGSYVFIGYILNNYPFEYDKPLDKTCVQCYRCVKACPGQIILGDFNIDPKKCKSYLTQKKGELPNDEEQIIKKTDLVFGCDVCQDVCPHNKNVEKTIIGDFKKDLIFNLDYEEISKMSNRGFKREYGNRAFSWRGKKPILRNLLYLENRE
ncbi:tRNA epoxyqueuosine(34) reductase QueG [Dethiothermospora halolimnae]|uniref:tRNA epoxyqueuosine(34) reductase QueG n=1 Tax=Dethiothermospora halolimnae TaxID=3114390 RepID=UPI003CCB8010